MCSLVNHWSHFLITERSQKVTYLCHTNPLIESTNATHSSQLSSSTGIRWAAVWPKVQPRCSQYHSQGRNEGEITEQQERGAGLVCVCGLRFPANRVTLRDGLGLGSECRIAWVTAVVGWPTPRLLWLSSWQASRVFIVSVTSQWGRFKPSATTKLHLPGLRWEHAAFLVLSDLPQPKPQGLFTIWTIITFPEEKTCF